MSVGASSASCAAGAGAWASGLVDERFALREAVVLFFGGAVAALALGSLSALVALGGSSGLLAAGVLASAGTAAAGGWASAALCSAWPAAPDAPAGGALAVRRSRKIS